VGGSISYHGMAEGLSRRYATASTDTGHEGSDEDGSFTLGHPEKVVDFGYRAVHEMTLRSKAIVAAYYGKSPTYSYWNGCSTGGRQGLTEAQRFASDYNGIIAGAPANFITHLQAWAVWTKQTIRKNPKGLVPPSKLSMLHNAVLAACDGRDGLLDGILNDPRRCEFDPTALLCKGEDGPDCLSAPQIEVVRTLYGPTLNPRTKEQIYPGLAFGSELSWRGRMKEDPPDITKDFPTSYLR
jgi:feruloyl esterase